MVPHFHNSVHDTSSDSSSGKKDSNGKCSQSLQREHSYKKIFLQFLLWPHVLWVLPFMFGHQLPCKHSGWLFIPHLFEKASIWHFMSFSSSSSNSFANCLPMYSYLTCQLFLYYFPFSSFQRSLKYVKACLLTWLVFHYPDIKTCQLIAWSLWWSVLIYLKSVW